jgi:hypothetical protein
MIRSEILQGEIRFWLSYSDRSQKD